MANPDVETTLLDLIRMDKTQPLNFTIIFKKLILRGRFEGNSIIIGRNKQKCISLEINRNGDIITTSLDSFFDISDKKKCIGTSNEKVSFNINETELNENSKKNKNMNILLFELVDAININLKSRQCELYDYATLEINKCVIALSILKIFTRKYGFYNEFGYANITENDTLDINTNLENTTKKLYELYQLAQTQTLKHILQHTFTKTEEFISKYPNDLLELTLSEFLDRLLSYCNGSINDNINKHFNTLGSFNFTMLLSDLENLITRKCVKYYTYNDSGNVLETSELVVSDRPTFKMLPYPKKHTFNITQDSTTKEYIITIT